MKKKVALITYHHTTNFGSLLQTFALAKSVEKLGYECEILDYRNDAVEAREKAKSLFDCRSFRELKSFVKYGSFKKNKVKEFELFTKKNMTVSNRQYTKDSIQELEERYDAYLVGSDLVWDFSINGHDLTYMLNFVPKDGTKIAYASSVGMVWDEKDKAEVAKALGTFSHIGVREHEIREELSKLIDVPTDFVCDPTMLLSGEEWKAYLAQRLIGDEYVLCYFADDNLIIYEDAKKYAREKELPLYLISYGWTPEGIYPIRPTKIEEFLSLLFYADTVFTASYHGMLFSMYFNKRFFYYNRGWKARMCSIASYADLESREQLNDKNINEEINYDRVNGILDSFRDESLGKLREYLSE